VTDIFEFGEKRHFYIDIIIKKRTFSRELSILRPKYHIDYNSWKIEGNLFGLDYEITDGTRQLVGLAAKELFRIRDTYYLEIINDRDALDVLMIAQQSMQKNVLRNRQTTTTDTQSFLNIEENKKIWL